MSASSIPIALPTARVLAASRGLAVHEYRRFRESFGETPRRFRQRGVA